jgi:hypothetical protein
MSPSAGSASIQAGYSSCLYYPDLAFVNIDERANNPAVDSEMTL